MAVSYRTSLQNRNQDASAAASEINPMNSEEITDTEEYTPCSDGRYKWYTKYHDTNYSTIDAQKGISMDASQVNITQETRSQFIPFKIPRYYDGMDLMDMIIQIHYQNASNHDGIAAVVNVSSSRNFITFGWLIDSSVTSGKGEVKFEITASGVNERGESYVWKTQPNGRLNVLEALAHSGSGVIEPDLSWYETFLFSASQTLASARTAADRAESAANEAAASAENINKDAIKEEIKGSIIDDVNAATDEKLKNHYVKSEIDQIIVELEESISKIDSLSNLKVGYVQETGDLTFRDGEKEITSIKINSLSNLKVIYTITEGKGILHFYNGETEITSAEIGSIDPSAEWAGTFKTGIINEVNNTISSSVGEISAAVTELTSTVEQTAADLISLEEKTISLTSASESAQKELETVKTLQSELQKEVTANTTANTSLTNTVSTLKNEVGGFNQDVISVNENLTSLEEKVNNITSVKPNVYDVSYSDNTFTLYENEEVKQQFTITGGSGGGSDSSTASIERITPASLVILSDKTALIEYSFSSIDNVGDSTGNGTASWKVGNKAVASSTALQGKNSFDITQYLKTGSNNIRLTITDSFGTIAAKTWTVTVVEFKIDSIFDDSLFYSGEVSFRYTPYGDIQKKIIFKLDDKEIGNITTSVTGRQMIQSIPAQEHGAHLLEVYMTAVIDGADVQSDSVYKDIIWVNAESSAPIIGCAVRSFTSKQYNTVTIPYVIYDPEHNPANVTLAVDGKTVSELSADRLKQIWSYKSSEIGEQTLTITCGEAVKTISANIEELGIDITPVTTNLALDFNPAGRSNHDSDRLWTDGKSRLTVSDNFDWSNGGYQTDKDGDIYFCVKAGTTASIDYKLFEDDAKKTGKNFKLIYKTTNVRDYDALALSCFDAGIGFKVFAQNAVLTSEQNDITVPYCEDNYMELEFNILPDSQYTEMVMWIDAVPTRVKLYSSSDSFTQPNPQSIVIGSDDCDVWIYRMKSYTMNLTDDEILDNRIADAKNADEMIERYMKNQIVGADGTIDPDILAERCPRLRVIKISAPHFTTGKKNEVSDTTVQHIYYGGRENEDNWTAFGSHKGQGTSSEYYGESARNIDLNLSGGFTLADGTKADKYGMTNSSVPVNYFNIKLNVASSENLNNAFLTREYNTWNPYLRPARLKDEKIRDTMEFHPCVIFVQETDPSNATVFNDGAWHFYGCGDFGNSKKNDEVFGMDPDNHKEFIIEVDNNTDDQTRFLSDDLTGETWDGDNSFEFRYSNPNCTEAELQAGKDAWQRVLSWVVNASPETFAAEFEDYFIKDSVLFYYLFTERHTMIDNRAKNTFWHTEDLIHWDICFDYDNDTAMGNDNEGGLTFTYGYEDTDTIGSKAVFNAHDSRLWCLVRDCLADDLAALYIRLESRLAWSSDRILKACEEYQSVKPERLWIADMRRKYFRTYEDNGTTSYLPMMHGDKKHQRRQYQKYQEKYIASKYVGSACTSDVITIRGYTPSQWTSVEPDGTLHIKPYADMYIVNRYGSNIVKQRAKRGNTYTVESPIAAMNDTEVYTYNASMVQSIGDISGFYAGYTDFGQAVKLTDLSIGSDVTGYSNTNMSDFDIGNNGLLEKLNLQNLPNLKKTISLSGCTNLEEFLADGSGITGVIFASGGKIHTAHLPAASSISGSDLYYLNDLTIENYENLTTLRLDNCPAVDEMELLSKAENLNRLRLTNINWNLDDTSLLDRLAKLSGIDENGYNTNTSVLSGSVHVPVMRQQKLDYYNSVWKDLTVTYDTMIAQYTVTFVNDDENHTVLDVQYVDKGGNADDPIQRETDPIKVPEKASTVSTQYTFAGWDDSFTNIFSDKTITAVYTEAVREYTVKYVSKGVVLKEMTAPYGSMVSYDGGLPVYTAEETAFKYYVFERWDKSGLVTGAKTINAVFSVCEYTDGYFDNKELNDLTPAELYAAMKLGKETSCFSLKDRLDFKFGIDYSYDDIEEFRIVESDMVFNGSNYLDTNLDLMREDRDFTLAIDYEFASGNKTGNVLAQCFQSDGSNGFKLWHSTEPKLSWGTDSLTPSSGLGREIVVLRHRAGSRQLQVYISNITGTSIHTQFLTSTRIPSINSTFVLGCSKADDGVYENFAKGTVHWCKVWYADLGETLCSDISQWIHETVPMELAKFKGYYMANAESKRAAITFLGANTLSIRRIFSNKSTNAGGWADSTLNTWMNTRLLKAISPSWKSLIKPVKVYSSIGNKSTELSQSACHFYIPSLYELDNGNAVDPYINETNATIAYMTNSDSRKRANISAPDICVDYWTRSPNISHANYLFTIAADGTNYGFSYPSYESGILPMFSIGVD